MNKKLDIRKNTNVLFILNIIILITMIFFKICYTNLNYSNLLINGCLVLNIVILLLGVIFNFMFIKNADKYDNSMTLKIIILIFIIYLLLNTVGIFLINKSISNNYTKINDRLSSYCDTFGCDKYETRTNGEYEEFIIKKTFFDYNNVENELEITTKYNTKNVISVTATVYSQNEMFSETLINEQIKNYFTNFNYDIKEEKIREAFDKRFESKVNDNNAIYKVTEIYNDKNELEKLKTVITLTLEQE